MKSCCIDITFRYPTASQIKKMKLASEMQKQPISYVVLSSDELQFEVTVPSQGVAAITLKL